MKIENKKTPNKIFSDLLEKNITYFTEKELQNNPESYSTERSYAQYGDTSVVSNCCFDDKSYEGARERVCAFDIEDIVECVINDLYEYIPVDIIQHESFYGIIKDLVRKEG